MMVAAVAKLGRAFAAQVEALRRLKNGGSQFVRVEHVHVNDGGKAIFGNVSKSGSSRSRPLSDHPHDKDQDDRAYESGD